MRGIGVAVITSTSGSGAPRAFPLQQIALLDPEAVLLVDDDRAEARELDALVQERVGPDEDVDRPLREALGDPSALGRVGSVGEERDPHGAFTQQRSGLRNHEPVEQASHRELVLLGEHLGRRHERALVAALHRDQQRGERHDRLPRPDLALQEAVHRRRRGHVARDVAHDALLVLGRARTAASRGTRRAALPPRRA